MNLVPDLSLSAVICDDDGGVLAIDTQGNALGNGSPSRRRLGMWSPGADHLWEYGFKAERVALTPHASFVKKDGEWFSAYENNPLPALTLRDEQDKYPHTKMFHPDDWVHVQTFHEMGLEVSDAVAATAALV